ncbi:hypothetical protein TNCV_4229942 [Trichonephila clavipes]|nr:hypothetical protein TNCV_4229942 [Trichonephila clavipes]
MRTSSELSPPLLTSTTHQRKDVSALDRFNVHRSPTRWVYSGNRLYEEPQVIRSNRFTSGEARKTTRPEFTLLRILRDLEQEEDHQQGGYR